MKFSVPLNQFKSALQKALPALPKKSTLPVLEHLHFSITENNMQIIATDQDITIMSSLIVEGAEDGSILVPGRRISKIIDALGTMGNIEFTCSESSHDIKIKTVNGKYSMKGLSVEEYLDLPELFESEKPEFDKVAESAKMPLGKTPAVYFNKNDISRLASKTVFAVSGDEFRPAMNGVLFQFRESFINAVATDSFRLVKAVCHSDKNQYPKELDVILPARAVDLLKKVDEDVIMSVIETRGKITHARFDVGDTIFITRLIDERFPPFDSVIPQSHDLQATLNQNELLSAIRRVAIFTSEISHQIKVQFDNNVINVFGEDEETGSEASETLACEYSGKTFEIGFNYRYLDDALINIDTGSEKPMIVMQFSESSRPVIIKPLEEKDELLMLIMPVRLH